MVKPVEFTLGSGDSVKIDVEPSGMARVASDGTIPEKVRRSFEASLAEVRQAAETAMRQFQTLAQPPDEVAIKFGIRMDVEAGAVIAKSGVHGHFEVTIRWSAPQPGG